MAIAAMPRTGSGKTDYGAIRALFIGRPLS
jgi:hypothetical protein